MLARLRSLRPRDLVALDGFAAVVLLAGSQYEIWTGQGRDNGWSDPQLVSALLAVPACLPVALRRRAPLAALATVTVATAVALALIAPEQGPLEPFVALILCIYSLGAQTDRRRAIREGASFGSLVLAVSLPALLLDWVGGDLVPALIWMPFAWVIGRLLRDRHERTLQLQALAEELRAERDQRERMAAEHERRRIARELHDVVAHSLSMMVLQAGGARLALDEHPERAREPLAAIERTGRDALAELRRVVGILREHDGERPALTPQPGLADLHALLVPIRETGLRVETQQHGEPQPLAAGVELAAYRIIQEALTNVVKHAEATCVHVAIRYLPDALEISIDDDGRGPPPDGRNGGHGVIGMRERASLYGGTLEAGARAEGGFAVHSRLPLHEGAP